MDLSQMTDIMQTVLIPLSNVLQYMTEIIGLCLIVMGLHRLRHHSGTMHAGKHHSPMATFFFIVCGSMMLAYSDLALAISETIFGGFIGPYVPPNPLNPIDYPNPMQVQYYIPLVENATDPMQQIEYFTFAVLLVVGLLSFVRGLLLLVKLGEGGHESTLPKALTHIGAGVIGVNAGQAYQVIQSFVGS